MTVRQEKLNTLFKKLVAEFLRLHPTEGLATVSACSVSGNVRSARVLVSVYPENAGEKTLRALQDMQKELMIFLKKNTRTKVLPKIAFILDRGEVNRQKIDILLQE